MLVRQGWLVKENKPTVAKSTEISSLKPSRSILKTSWLVFSPVRIRPDQSASFEERGGRYGWGAGVMEWRRHQNKVSGCHRLAALAARKSVLFVLNVTDRTFFQSPSLLKVPPPSEHWLSIYQIDVKYKWTEKTLYLRCHAKGCIHPKCPFPLPTVSPAPAAQQ